MFVYISMFLTGPPTVIDKVSLRCLSCIRAGTIMQNRWLNVDFAAVKDLQSRQAISVILPGESKLVLCVRICFTTAVINM